MLSGSTFLVKSNMIFRENKSNTIMFKNYNYDPSKYTMDQHKLIALTHKEDAISA